MKKTRICLLAIVSAATLSACGKKSETPASPDAATATAGALGEAAAKAAETAKVNALPKPDLGKPLSEYQELKGGQQLMFMYVAASRMPPDFEKMAETYSREYRETSDTFRQHDLMTAIKPQLEQGIAQATAAPYAWVSLENTSLQPYDFERKGFAVDEFSGSTVRYFNDASYYRYSWVNKDQLLFAPVADENVARELESMRTKWNNKPQLKVYFFAQSADLNNNWVNAYVTRVQITDKTGKVLVDYGPDQTKAAGSN